MFRAIAASIMSILEKNQGLFNRFPKSVTDHGPHTDEYEVELMLES